MADKVSTAINTVLAGLDDHIRDYISSVLADDPSQEVSHDPRLYVCGEQPFKALDGYLQA